jgi:general secretion pathway protein K
VKKEGVALILVLAVTVVLSVLVVEFVYIMKIDTRIMEYRQDDRTAYHLGRGGVRLAETVLSMDSPLIDSLNDIWAEDFPVLIEPGGEAAVEIYDEDRKLNVNRIIKQNGETDRNLQAMLARLLNIHGADSSAAEKLSEELHARGGAGFSTTRELLGIEGFELVIDYVTVYTDGRVNINTACAGVLESLSDGIDSSLAREIVLSRESAPFGSVSQLLTMPGMSENTLRQISEYVKVNSGVFKINVRSSSGLREKNITAVVERIRNDFRVLYWRAV